MFWFWNLAIALLDLHRRFIHDRLQRSSHHRGITISRTYSRTVCTFIVELCTIFMASNCKTIMLCLTWGRDNHGAAAVLVHVRIFLTRMIMCSQLRLVYNWRVFFIYLFIYTIESICMSMMLDKLYFKFTHYKRKRSVVIILYDGGRG